VRAPTLGEFVQQFGGAYFATEGALWRTLKLLLLRPGDLTRQYLTGRRKHYVLPLRLYLTISVVTLLLMRAAGSGGVDIEFGNPAEVTREANSLTVRLGTSSAGLRQGVFFCENLPAWICARLQRRIDVDPQRLAGEVAALRDRFLGNLGGAMFVLLPGFAMGLKLVYANRRMHYAEHLVFALHAHAFWFTALALTLPNRWWLSSMAFVAIPAYTLLAMKRVYGGRKGPLLLRAALLSLLYGVMLGVTVFGVALWSLLT